MNRIKEHEQQQLPAVIQCIKAVADGPFPDGEFKDRDDMLIGIGILMGGLAVKFEGVTKKRLLEASTWLKQFQTPDELRAAIWGE